jgi:glycosyltransferase involved in cell wall biosynthesis
VASLTPHKGHAVLLEAAGRVPGARVVLVGDGPQREPLAALAGRLGIRDRVVFAGRRDSVWPCLRAVDVAALASTEREGLGIALIEAMAACRPVVASRLGGIPEVVEDGRTGLLVDPGDAAALAAALQELAADAERRRRMGEEGRRRFERRFTVARMMTRIETLYAEGLA